MPLILDSLARSTRRLANYDLSDRTNPPIPLSWVVGHCMSVEAGKVVSITTRHLCVQRDL